MSFRRQITRRQFMKGAAIAGGAMMMPGLKPFVRDAHAFGVSMRLQKFVDPLPLFNAQIPLAQKAAAQPYSMNGTPVDYYELTAGMYQQQLHRQLPVTKLYGYKSTPGNYAHLGGAVLATKGIPVRIKFASALPATHILPFDPSVPSQANGGYRQDRAAIHLHGGLVPWTSDGGPFHWESNAANPGGLQKGASVIPWLWDGGLDAVGAPNPNSVVWDYFYPNNQNARLMWYHDHAIAITRLNAYAGIATGYVMQDGNDSLAGGVLQTMNNIPFLGQPLVFQDKVFWEPANDPLYANYVPGAARGDLWYPWFYDPAIWPIAKGGIPPIPSAVPEFFGDTMLVNGHVYPFHEVGAGWYRFRLLNACNARFLDLSFVMEDPVNPGEPLFARNGRPVAAAVNVWQIGTEGGFLRNPVQLVANGVPTQPFILGGAERADILVQFPAPAAGVTRTNIILYNVAGSPFPGGAPIFDWYVGNKKTPVPVQPGFGPNTRTIMQFRVLSTPPAGNPPAAGLIVPTPPAPGQPAIPVPAIPTIPDPVNGGLMVDAAAFNATFGLEGYTYDPLQIPEKLTLNEVVEPLGFAQGVGFTGRLLTLLGNAAAPAALPFGVNGIYYAEAPTETVQYKTLRIWEVYNLTVDAHPMHFHLFDVQILGRRKITKGLAFTGLAVAPALNEMGFKETVVAYPGECVIVAALVEDPLPAPTYPREIGTNRPQVPVTVQTAAGPVTVPSTLPFSPRLQGFGINGDEYVWHCHILEHEEHDMMRPMVAKY